MPIENFLVDYTVSSEVSNHLFVKMAKTIPNSIEIIIEKRYYRKLILLLREYGFVTVRKRSETNHYGKKKPFLNTQFIILANEERQAMVAIEESLKDLYINFLYLDTKVILPIYRRAKKFVKKDNESKISIILQNRGGELYLKEQTFQARKKIDLSLNYGETFLQKDRKIKEEIATDGVQSLILLHGKPGTGKTTYIRYLISHFHDKEFIIVPLNVMEEIDNPKFLTFILNHQNAVLIVEDAEKLIRNRSENSNNLIGLLNASDGILGDILKLKIILTFNTERENIDPALLRKGRLKVEHYFEELSIEASNRLLQHLGSKRSVERKCLLTEIYNTDTETVHIETRNPIGF
ncbi:MAG: AAA family ATPase [Spirochaetota bacterium]